jgi:hypothetical protein
VIDWWDVCPTAQGIPDRIMDKCHIAIVGILIRNVEASVVPGQIPLNTPLQRFNTLEPFLVKAGQFRLTKARSVHYARDWDNRKVFIM